MCLLEESGCKYPVQLNTGTMNSLHRIDEFGMVYDEDTIRFEFINYVVVYNESDLVIHVPEVTRFSLSVSIRRQH